MKSEIDRQIDDLEYQRQELDRRIADLRRRRPREAVRDHVLRSTEGGSVRLSTLFGDKRSLLLVHNMGRDCSYCTMWADGFVGILPHLESHAAFVVTSPDPPEEQRAFAAGRGWTFPLYSAERAFIEEMGFVDAEQGLMPGVSAFEKEADGSLWRVGRAEFGPGDRFCSVWHFFDLCAEGVGGWEPRFAYP